MNCLWAFSGYFLYYNSLKIPLPNQVISTLNVDKNFVTFVVTIFSSSAKPTDKSKQTISSQIFIFEINSHITFYGCFF